MISLGKKFNILMVMLILVSSWPWGVDASYNDVRSPNLGLMETQGGRYFSPKISSVISGVGGGEKSYEQVMDSGYRGDMGRTSYAWYSSSWGYRKEIVIAGSVDGIQSNYQMKLIVHYGGLDADDVPATGIIHTPNASVGDFDDLRFTNSSNTTELHYWIESYTASTNATVWVEVDSIAAAPTNTTIYMYYGNALAGAPDTSQHMGEDTFIFFDHFEYAGAENVTDKWEGDTGKMAVVASICTVDSGGTAPNVVNSKADFAGPVATRAYSQYVYLGSASVGFYGDANNFCFATTNRLGQNLVQTDKGAVFDGWTTNWTVGSYSVKDFIWDTVTPQLSWFDNNAECILSPYLVVASIPVMDMAYYMRFDWAQFNDGIILTDWVLVRKYTTTEPTWSSFDGEVESIGMVSTLIASNVEETTATLSGNITDTGAGNVTIVGSQYGEVVPFGTRYEHNNVWNTVGGLPSAFFTSGLPPYGFGYSIFVQQFTPTISHNVTNIQLRMARKGSPGTVTVSIQTIIAGDNPDGINLASGSFDGNTLPSFVTWPMVTPQLVDISLGAGAWLTAGTMYAIVVTNTGAPNSNNYIAVVTDGSNSYAGGDTRGRYLFAWFHLAQDFWFEEWNVNPHDTVMSSGNFGVGVFSNNVTSLIEGTYYYFRAFATNSLGTAYGGYLGLLTKPNPPSGLTANYVNSTALQLDWTKGTGAANTYIRGSNTTYPLLISDGSLVCNTTAATYTHGSLTALETMYYTAWSWVSANGIAQYSDTAITVSVIVPSGIPIVYTNASTGYGNNWATVSGLVASSYPYPTLFGFQYGTTVAYGSFSNTTAVVAGGIFSATITGLTPGASYHYRAFAVNSYGTGYGADMMFSTGGTATSYEGYNYGCNTTWNTVYETDATSISSNWTGGVITSANWTPIHGNNWTAQTFTTNTSHSVNQVIIWVKREVTLSTSYIYVSIRDAAAGDNITSPDLGTGLYAAGYTSVTGGPIEVSLENEIQLEANHKYAIVVRAPALSPNTTDYISILSSDVAGGSIYANGNSIRSITGGASWVTDTNYDFYFTIIGKPQPIYGNIEVGQTFTVGASSHTLERLRLILGRVGQPGNIYISLRNYTGGVLSNADLAICTLNGNAITIDKAMYDCVLTPEKSLEAGKQYAIVVTAPSGDRYNYILWCADALGGLAVETALKSSDAGLTWAAQSYDYNFQVWGNPVLSVINAKVFKNYLVAGDWLICAEILNVSPPYYDANEDPSAFYIFSFMGLVGTTYAATPCKLWNKSPLSIYMNPTQAAALSWGGNYKVRLSNLAGTIYAEYALLSTDWNAASLAYLDNWARLCAKDMEGYMSTRSGTTVTYTTYVADKGYVLNQDGGAIFNEACPRLSYVRPNLFQITNNEPDIITSPIPATPGADEMDYHTRLGAYLSGLIDKAAAAMGVADPLDAGGIIILAIYAIIAFGTVMKGFAWAGMIAAFPVLLIGMYYGLLSVNLILILLAILAFLFMREFFFKGM